MADVFDPAFWQRQVDALVAAPVTWLVTFGVGAGGAWWLRGQIKDGEIAGLKARIDALEERLQLSADKLQQSNDARGKLEADLQKIQHQLDAREPTPDIKQTARSASDHLQAMTKDWSSFIAYSLDLDQPLEKPKDVTSFLRDVEVYLRKNVKHR